MKKKVFLAVALIALMTGVLSAQTYDSESDFQVTKTATAVTITKYVGTKTAVNIPPRIQNLPVTQIGNNAFAGNAKLTSVTIPNGIGSIGTGAFMGTGLTSVNIPESVSAIGDMAFRTCNNLISVTFGGRIITGSFGSSFPFEGDLRTKFYSANAAQGTPGTYTRPNGTSQTWTATSVATAASSGDSESDFEIEKAGNSVTIIEYKGSKTVVNIPPSIQNIPVTTVGQSAFAGNAKLTSVIIPNSVTNIGRASFRDCTKLTSITLPNKLNNIDTEVFYGSGLTSVTIPNSVTTIGEGAFRNCGLTSVTIPNSVTRIGVSAFRDCTNLISVTFGGTIPSANFPANAFNSLGDLRDKFYATDKANGTAGTYTRPNGTSTTWTKK